MQFFLYKIINIQNKGINNSRFAHSFQLIPTPFARRKNYDPYTYSALILHSRHLCIPDIVHFNYVNSKFTFYTALTYYTCIYFQSFIK